MAKNLMVVFTNPVEGREDEFNDWYDNEHLADVVGGGPFARAQRFVLADVDHDVAPDYRYLALYEIEDGKTFEDARRWIVWSRGEREEALAAGRRPAVPMTDAIAEQRVSFMYGALAEPFEKPKPGTGDASG
ncbi:MAG: hypothetical protein FJW96_01905 [Actinobacteria bacterium]|nr:hypothetical protein [Actinomycetota bacterium]